MCSMLDSMYVTMSISTGLYPDLDLWNANKLHYIGFHKMRGISGLPEDLLAS